LSSAEQKVLNARPTESTEAHQLYLRGRYVMEKRTPADLNKAAEYFNQAITQDPNYAAAYAGLADCYVLLPQWKQGPVAEYLSKARAAAMARPWNRRIVRRFIRHDSRRPRRPHRSRRFASR
jgi:Tfp pilus assembly protein PilF